MYSTLANRDVECGLIPESPSYLEGEDVQSDFTKKWLKENGYAVIVIAKRARKELLSESMHIKGSARRKDARISQKLRYGC